MDWTSVFDFITGLLGVILAAGLTVFAISYIRRPLAAFLGLLIADEQVVKAGASFVALLIGLRGLSAVLGFITQTQLSRLLMNLSSMLQDLAGVVQWAAYIAALLFIGYSIRANRVKENQAEQ
jgi:hypothetical protein